MSFPTHQCVWCVYVTLFPHRFTWGSSTGRDTPPSVLTWWAVRSWRSGRVNCTLTTTNEAFAWELSPLYFSNNSIHRTSSSFSLELINQSESTKNICIWQMKQYFNNDLYINVTLPLCFKNLHLALMWNESDHYCTVFMSVCKIFNVIDLKDEHWLNWLWNDVYLKILNS